MSAATPAPEAIYWNGWSSNYLRAEMGYIIHAWQEGTQQAKEGRALCGAPIHNGVPMRIPHETTPGCIRCRRILIKRGVMKADD